MLNLSATTPDTESFVFWTPSPGMTLSIGEDQHLILPLIPLPLRTYDQPKNPDIVPSERLIGEGLYDYLCSFPEAEHAAQYANILRQAYPFLISDIGSQLLLLDFRNTDVAALQRKISLLKILLLLDPDNFGVLHKMGVSFFNLSIHPHHLLYVRECLVHARQCLEKARRLQPDNSSNLNYIGQVCYLSGNYHQARLYWQSAINQQSELETTDDLAVRMDYLSRGFVPAEPLQDVLERLGQARKYFLAEEYALAYALVEQIVQQGDILRELPTAELYYFIGCCREKAEDLAGAYEAQMMAVKIDNNHEQARIALERVTPVAQKRA